jgi:hypothetical protein
MNPRYSLVAQRAAHRCEYCHAPEAVFNFPFEVEHIVPGVQRGRDDESNWALSCRSCNLNKSIHLTGWDDASQSEVRLFNPRLDSWNEHFLDDANTGEVKGVTPVGRATVARLRMNSATQLEARRVWVRLGLFP